MDHGHLCRHVLYGHHHRDRKQTGPEQGIADTSACQRVGRDPGRVIVGRPADQTRAKPLEENEYRMRFLRRRLGERRKPGLVGGAFEVIWDTA
jgi:hypothetical protein